MLAANRERSIEKITSAKIAIELEDAIQQQAGTVNPRRKILDQAMDSRIDYLQSQLAQLQRENEELKKENAKLYKALGKKNLNLDFIIQGEVRWQRIFQHG